MSHYTHDKIPILEEEKAFLNKVFSLNYKDELLKLVDGVR